MYYTIYKVTNKVNGKYYIGKHQTVLLTDSYLGSGKLLQRAIKKYGTSNFTKEILYTFDNEAEMNTKEAELVMVSKDTYNICEGGKGGFGYVNRTGLNIYGKNGQLGYGGDNLAKGRIKREPKYCIRCGTEIGKHAKKYCSSSCAASVNNIGIRRNPLGTNQHVYKFLG